MAPKKIRKLSSKSSSSGTRGYLTKRILVTKAKAAGKEAAKNAMSVMGFVVVAQDSLIIKKYRDGRIEIIEAI